MGITGVVASLRSTVNLSRRSSKDRLLSVLSADNYCSLSANCFRFALWVSHLDYPRLSDTFVNTENSLYPH